LPGVERDRTCGLSYSQIYSCGLNILTLSDRPSLASSAQATVRPLQLIPILAATSLLSMAGGAISPVRPEIVTALGVDPIVGGNLGSAHNLTIALFSAPLGILADRIGPVRVLVPSLLLFAGFGVAGAWMQSFGPLLVLRAFLGVAAGGIAAGSLGAIAQLYRGEARSQAIALATSTLTLSGIVYLLLGGWVGSWDWRYAFYLYGIGVPMAVLVAWAFRKSPLTDPTATVLGGGGSKGQSQLLATLRYPPVMRVLGTIAAVAVVLFSVVIYAPEYLQVSLGLDSKLNGVILAARALGAALSSAIAAKPLAKAVSRDGAIAIGFAGMCATLISIPIVPQVFPPTTITVILDEPIPLLPFGLTLAAALGFGAGFGLVLPNLYGALADYAPDRTRTSLLAIGTGVSYLGQSFSPILLGPLLLLGELPIIFYSAAGITILTGGSFFLARKR